MAKLIVGNNNILLLLLRIPYIYDPIADKSKIETIVLEFVKTHTIPKEILNFYKEQKTITIILFLQKKH